MIDSFDRLTSAASVRPDERVAAGRAAGGVWAIMSLSIIALSLVLPAGQVNRPVLIALGAAGVAWGALSGWVLDYSRLSVWIIHASTIIGIAVIGLAIILSGGAGSPAWACLFYVVVFSAAFFPPTMASAYFVACVIVECIVVLAASPVSQNIAVARLVIAAPAFVVLGATILAGKWSLYDTRRRAERLAAEQGALRRVATAVVSGETPERFYEIVAVEAGRLLAADGAGILRFGPSQEATVLGSWSREPSRSYGVGSSFPVSPDDDVSVALQAGRPVHISETEPNGSLGRLGYRSSVVAPIKVSGRLWGFLTIVADDSHRLSSDHARRLNEFADLICSAVSNIEDRAALAAQAATDALTGVGNHRTFHQRLGADLARARRYGTAVSVAVIDVDHFKQVNDTHGHEAGDEMLTRVARCLSAAGRAEDTVARIGGDEFAWILPETSSEEALAAVQRARDNIIAGNATSLPITVSGGVCDTRWTFDATELVRLADRALYASKENGRDQVRPYSRDPAEQLA